MCNPIERTVATFHCTRSTSRSTAGPFVATMFWLDMVRSKWSWDCDPDHTDEPLWGKRLTTEEFHRLEAILAEVLLNHVNDTHFFAREKAGQMLRTIFLRRVSDLQAANPTKKPIEAPGTLTGFGPSGSGASRPRRCGKGGGSRTGFRRRPRVNRRRSAGYRRCPGCRLRPDRGGRLRGSWGPASGSRQRACRFRRGRQCRPPGA